MSGLWQEKAACRDADPLRFFADGNTRDELIETAEEFCGTCPVADECGQDADAHRDTGLRGGSYRNGRHGGYTRTPLIDGAAVGRTPEPRPAAAGPAAKVDLDEVSFLTSCGLSQDAIADRLGVKADTLVRLEQRAAARARTEQAVARAVEAAEDEPVSWASAATMRRALEEAFGHAS